MRVGVTYQKGKAFAIRIVKLYQYLRDEKKEYVLSKQILRCGTSIGANIAEANCAFSEKDFPAKMYIAFKECAETEYRLELFKIVIARGAKEKVEIATSEPCSSSQ